MDFPAIRGGKSFVRRLIRHKRIFLFAGHPAQAMGHEPQELNRQGGLRFEAPGWIAQPMFGDAANERNASVSSTETSVLPPSSAGLK